MNLMKSAYESDEDHMDESELSSKTGTSMALTASAGEIDVGSALATVRTVTGADATQFVNSGASDDPEWVKPDAGELVIGEEGKDWVVDYATRLGPKVFGRLVRRERVRPSEVGTKGSAAKIFLDLALRPGGVRVLENSSGFRVLSLPKPDDPRLVLVDCLNEMDDFPLSGFPPSASKR